MSGGKGDRDGQDSPAVARPVPIVPRPEDIPLGLRSRSQWLCWQLEAPLKPSEKQRKVPYQPTATGTPLKASTTNPRHWRSFAEAFAVARARGWGVGYVFTADDPYVGVDLDDALSSARVAQTMSWVDRANTYTEVSQSGVGVHLIVEASLPDDLGRRSSHDGIELYSTGRYFAITGKRLPGVPLRDPRPNQGFIDGMLTRMPERTGGEETDDWPERVGLRLDDLEVLRRIGLSHDERCKALLKGDIGDFPSASEADFSLANRLAYWTGGDAEQTLRLIASSPLWRDKWERADYQWRTVGRACKEAIANGNIHRMYTPSKLGPYIDEGNVDDFLLRLRLPIRTYIERKPAQPNELIPGLLPDPEWVRYGILTAQGGTGKSTLLLQTLMGLGSGRQIAEMWKPTAPTQVIYFAGEDPAPPIWHRVNAIGAITGYTSEEIAAVERNVHIIEAMGNLHALQLMTFDGQNYVPNAQVIELLAEHKRKHLPECKLVVFDTLSRFAPDAERSNELAGHFVASIESLAAKIGVMILIAHHTSKRTAGDLNIQASRGASTLTENARLAINMAPTTQHNIIDFSVSKFSYGATTNRALQFVRGAGGVLRLHREVGFSRIQEAAEVTDIDQTILRVVDVAAGWITAKRIVDHPRLRDTESKRQLTDRIGRLVATGYLIEKIVGNTKKYMAREEVSRPDLEALI